MLATFAGHRKVVAEMLPPEQQADAQAFLDFYAALAAKRLGQIDVYRTKFQGESLAALRQADPYFETPADLVEADTQSP